MGLQVQDLTYPAHVSEGLDVLAGAVSAAERIFLFLPYEGAVVPGPRWNRHRPSRALVQELKEMCDMRHLSVYVVSERGVSQLRSLLSVSGLGFVGQRGLEIAKPGRSTVYPIEPGKMRQLIHRLELEAHRSLKGSDTIAFESRDFALVMRLGVSDPAIAREASLRLVNMVREFDTEGRLEILHEGDVVEARVAGWHQGDAIARILKEADPADSLVVYIGSDVTDEDTFEIVERWGEPGDRDLPWFPELDGSDEAAPPRALTVLVTDKPRPTKASLFVRTPDEVCEFIASLGAMVSALL